MELISRSNWHLDEDKGGIRFKCPGCGKTNWIHLCPDDCEECDKLFGDPCNETSKHGVLTPDFECLIDKCKFKGAVRFYGWQGVAA